MPALFVLDRPMEAFRRQLLALHRPVAEVDIAPKTLHLGNELSVTSGVHIDVFERRGDRGIGGGQQDQPLVNRGDTPMKQLPYHDSPLDRT